MSKLEFISLLTPSVASFVLVLLAWMNSNSRLSRLETVVDTVANHLREFYRIPGKVEGRLDEISHR